MAVPPITVNNIRTSFPERRIVVKLTSGTKKNSKGEPLEFFINKEGNLIDVKVKLKRNYGGIDPQARVSILNLNQDTMRMFMTKDFSPKNPDTITVYAGYETVGQKTSDIPFLFTANILWAIPTTGRPDIWFDIMCVENFFNINEKFKIDKRDLLPMTPFGIIKTALILNSYWALEKNPLRVDIFDTLKTASKERWEKYQTPIPDYNFELNTLAYFLSTEPYQWNKMQCNILNGEVWAIPNSDDMNFLATVVKPDLKISASSKYPMIDIPKPNPTGVDFVTLFNRDLLPNVYFELDSKIFTAWNRVYWIQTVVYDLHLRGKNFYTIVQARR